MTVEELEARKQEIIDAFATVLDVIDLATEMGDTLPQGTYHYLWKKKFKLEGLEMKVQS